MTIEHRADMYSPSFPAAISHLFINNLSGSVQSLTERDLDGYGSLLSHLPGEEFEPGSCEDESTH